MSYSARLVNPTPLHISWTWHRGIVLKIEPFGSFDISAQMMEQFMPDQPGYDGIRQEMEYHGVFLQNTNQTYETQAEDTLKKCIKARKSLYDDCEKGVRKRAADSGNLKETAIQAELERSGYTRLNTEIGRLDEVLKTIQAANSKIQRTMHDQYDPERTLLFTNPPKEFPSSLAMKLFLLQPENSVLRKQQEQYLAQFNNKQTSSEKTGQSGTVGV